MMHCSECNVQTCHKQALPQLPIFVSQEGSKTPISLLHLEGPTPQLNAPDPKTKTNNIWDLGRTPINTAVLKTYLDQYPNTELAHKLYLGFTQGFKLHYLGPRLPIQTTNLVSAYENHRETWDKICREIELGRIGGPFVSLPISNLRISPIGVVPKGNNPVGVS